MTERKEALLKATQPGVGGGAEDGPSSLYNAILHTGAVAAVPTSSKAEQALLEGLRRTQQKDGLWRASGQFQGIKRPKGSQMSLMFNNENKKDHTQGDKVFSYWGTTWSVIGLLQTMPK
jgi:hypothetical protein